MWAAKLVIESTPRWFRNFYLFELATAKVEMLKALRDSQPAQDKTKHEPKRSIEIYPGDFNQNIIKMLAENPIKDKEASFCLLDQRTFECNWNSVKAIAMHKNGGNKIELFYFFPEAWIDRSIAAIKIKKNERLSRWWGQSNWAELRDKQGADRALFVCDRFKTELGYKHVNPFAIYERKDRGGRIMYYMIHASDHDEAPVLMNRAYGKALDIIEPPEQLDFLSAGFKFTI
jgi:three-Cys-motif partner protein